MKDSFSLPRSKVGRYYHIDCGPGDIAPFVLTTGDPARAAKIAGHFDEVIIRRGKREFHTFTGSCKGIPVTAMSTGIGTDNTAIAVIEASQCRNDATFIRVGSSGGIDDEVAAGDLVISEKALREEGTTLFYAPAEMEAVADKEVTDALRNAADSLDFPFHAGLTATICDFYAGQGRTPAGFKGAIPGRFDWLRKQGVLNVEMEMAAYFILSDISDYPIRAGGICAVFDNMASQVFGDETVLRIAEERAIDVALKAAELLAG